MVSAERLQCFSLSTGCLDHRADPRLWPDMENLVDAVRPVGLAEYSGILGRCGEQTDDGCGTDRVGVSTETSCDQSVRPHRIAECLIVPANRFEREDNAISSRDDEDVGSFPRRGRRSPHRPRDKDCRSIAAPPAEALIRQPSLPARCRHAECSAPQPDEGVTNRERKRLCLRRGRCHLASLSNRGGRRESLRLKAAAP